MHKEVSIYIDIRDIYSMCYVLFQNRRALVGTVLLMVGDEYHVIQLFEDLGGQIPRDGLTSVVFFKS